VERNLAAVLPSLEPRLQAAGNTSGDIGIRFGVGEILEGFRGAFFSRKRFWRLCKPANGGTVTENHQLPGVFDNMIPTPSNFAHEHIHPDKSFYVTGLSAYHGTLLYGLGIKEVHQPDIR